MAVGRRKSRIDLPVSVHAPRREKVFGAAPGVPLDRNAKARIMFYTKAYNARTREEGQHTGPVTRAFMDVLRALLYSFHNAKDGRCFPSYERIAEIANCARSMVYEAIRALERAGVLTWVNRLTKIRVPERDLFGRIVTRWQVIRTSNSYRFLDPKGGAPAGAGCKFENPSGPMVQESLWCLVERLMVLMRKAQGEERFSIVFSKYLESHIFPCHVIHDNDDRLYSAGFQISIPSYTFNDDIKYRCDVQALEKLLNERWGWFVRQHGAAAERWKKISAPVRSCLLCCAADRISFGDRYSSFPADTFALYEELIVALVSLSKDTKARLDEAEEKEQAAEERKRIEKECAEKVGEILYGPPESLEARVLDAAQIVAVRDACIKEIKQGPKDVYEVAGTIDDFAQFCKLLPENHVKVKSAQYVEKPGRSRTEMDMVNEISRECVGLPKYTAYARVVGEKDGRAIVWKGKVETIELPRVETGAFDQALEAIEENGRPYTQPREKIREEIAKRQEPWRKRVRVEAPSVRVAKKKGAASEKGAAEPEAPMPPRFFNPE